MYIANSRAATKKIKRGYWSHFIKCSTKTTKGKKKSVEDKNRNKIEGKQIENSNKHGRY